MHKTIDKVLAGLMKAKGLNQKTLSEGCGVPQSTISRILKPSGVKGIKSPSDEQVYKLAIFFGVSTDQMRGREPLADNLGLFASTANPDLSAAPQFISNVEGEPALIKDGIVPVVGMAQLGSNGYFEALDFPVGHGDGYIQIYSSDPNAYALKVVGDSMEPRIRSGEYVLIEPNKSYMAGDEVLVKTIDGQSMIKVFMYCRDGEVRLLSVNEAHAPITMMQSQIDKIHVVGAIVRPSRYISV